MDDQGLEYWGIISVELIKGEVDFYRIREAKPNPKAKLKNKMSLLWKSEFSHILSGNKLPKYAQKSKKFITEKLMEKVPEEILHEQISEELFERDYTIYDYVSYSDAIKDLVKEIYDFSKSHPERSI